MGCCVFKIQYFYSVYLNFFIVRRETLGYSSSVNVF